MPRDLERFETVKEIQEEMLEKSLEQIEQEKAQKYKIQGCCEN
jgi:hypothetical protein